MRGGGDDMKGFLFFWNIALTIAVVILAANLGQGSSAGQVETNAGNIQAVSDFSTENR